MNGIEIIAAAGSNYGFNTDFPARYDEIVSVTAVDRMKNISKSYSARGTVDYAMPGVSILTTSKNGGYAIYSGASMATAHMTGAISDSLKNDDDSYSMKKNGPYSLQEINELLKDNLVSIKVEVNLDLTLDEDEDNRLISIETDSDGNTVEKEYQVVIEKADEEKIIATFLDLSTGEEYTYTSTELSASFAPAIPIGIVIGKELLEALLATGLVVVIDGVTYISYS